MNTGSFVRVTFFYLLSIASFVIGGFIFRWGTQLWGTGGELFGGVFALLSIVVRFWSTLFASTGAVGLAAGTYELTRSLKRH